MSLNNSPTRLIDSKETLNSKNRFLSFKKSPATIKHTRRSTSARSCACLSKIYNGQKGKPADVRKESSTTTNIQRKMSI